MRQTLVATLLSAFLAASAHAQEPGRTYRVGVLTLNRENLVTVPRDMLPPLAQSGFIQGRNLTLDVRFGRVDQLGENARDLAAQSDVIVALGIAPLIAAREATRTLPIVAATSDPVGRGFAQSLSRPGGNVTGVALLAGGTAQKQMELLVEAVPTIRRIAVLSGPGISAEERELISAMANVGVEVRFFTPARQGEYPAVFAAMREAGMGALAMDLTPQFASDIAQIQTLALEARLPTVCAYPEAVPVGCMLSYGLNNPAVRGRVGCYVVRILRGESPAEMPIEQPMEFVVRVNLRTARALGLTLPQAIMLRADEVIE
jgi:putative ABC transport system substrate-binding protein